MQTEGQKDARRYIRRAGVAALAVLCGVVAFNALIDPFRMYDFLEIPGLNFYKPAVYERVRLMKAYEVRRLKPRGIVLGTSRAHVAIDPEHRGWDPRATPRYNLAFDAATTREMYRYLLHAQATRPLVEVVLGLEYYQLHEEPGRVNPDFDPDLLRDPRSRISLPLFVRADLKLLSSMDTLEAGIETVRDQSHASPEWFAPDGQRIGRVFFRELDGTFKRSGPRAYFDEWLEWEVGNKLKALAQARRPVPGTAAAPEGRKADTSLAYVGRIVRFCHENGIDLRIYISPVHADELELSAAVGEFPYIESGKRALVRLLDEDASRHPGEPPVPLYDFNGYSSVTTEPLPPRGSREEMRYFWDPSHAKQRVGDFILDRIFGVDDPRHPVPADFGIRLRPDNIDAALARIRARQAAYRAAHPSEVAKIRALVARVRKKLRRGGEEPS